MFERLTDVWNIKFKENQSDDSEHIHNIHNFYIVTKTGFVLWFISRRSQHLGLYSV
jgi:hypothetical protein